MKKTYLIIIAGAITGAIAGWLYWNFIGCSSGTCPITSRPLSSTLYGSMMGAVLFSGMIPSKNKSTKS